MPLGRLPNIPDPSVIVQAGTEAAKAVGQGAMGVGADLAVGTEQILFNTIEGGLNALKTGASQLVALAKADIDAGRSTADKVRSDIDQACNTVLAQADRAFGQEVVKKFKSEVENLLR